MSATTTRGKVEYCLFDMDGLLSGSVDSERIYTDVTNILLAKYGFGKMTWAMKEGQMGRPAPEATRHLFSFFPGIEDKVSVEDFMAERFELQDEAFRKVEPMKGAIDLVKGLHEAGVPIAIATGSNSRMFTAKTSHLPHLFDYFPRDRIVTADLPQVKRGKPFPDVFLAAAHTLGMDVGTSEECTPEQEAVRRKGIVFEDAVPGIKAGLAAGMNVVWVPDENLLALNPTETHGATQVVMSLEDFKPEEWGLPHGPRA